MRVFLIGFGIFIALMAIVYGSLFQLDVLPRVALAPGWALEADQGQRLTSDDLRGKITIYTFSYTRNQHPLRRPEPVLQELQHRLADDTSIETPVRFLTVTIDPEHDTPEAIRQTTDLLDADPDQWWWLRGDPGATEALVREGFGVFYRRQNDGSFQFDPVFVVVDGTGVIRARYRFGIPEAETLMKDIRSLTREARAANGTARLAYEAAHLFSCYSRTNL